MKLPAPATAYDRNNEAQTRQALERADADNLKTGLDAYLVGTERLFVSHQTGITAHAGGGKASATVLTKAINHVTTCATAGDSVLMPPAKAGMRVCTINRGAASMQVFGQGSDTIDDVATATGIVQPVQTAVDYVCPVDGKWYST